MDPANWQLLQAVALGSLVAWASGLRLYLVAFVLGLAARTGYLALPEGLAILSHPYVIAASGFLLAVEFLADKVPGVDSAWDAVHTFIRIPAGAVLAATAFGDFDKGAQVIAFLLGGGLAFSSHGTKAAARAVINTSPEPVTNVVASLTEDVVAVSSILLAVFYPVVIVVVVVIGLVISLIVLKRTFSRD